MWRNLTKRNLDGRDHRRDPRGAAAIVGGLAMALTAASCSGDDSSGSGDDTSPTTSAATPTTATTETTTAAPPTTEPPEVTSPADAATIAAIQVVIDAAPNGCDALDARQCVLPFPSDAVTVGDDTTATGLRVAFPDDGLPANSDGIHIDPTQWNLNDGFSANSPLLTYIADLDPDASDLPTWTNLESSLDDDASVVLIDTATGERIPLWAEPDVGADDPTERLLVIHPAISLAPGTTFAVGLRGLVSTSGDAIEPSPAFAVYRDALDTGIDQIEDRRAAMEATLAALEDAGVDRDDLQLAWSFTTASTATNTRQILHMRDETLAGLQDSTPEYQITTVTEHPRDGLARLVEGVFSVPNYLEGDGGPGSAMNLDADGLPEQNGVVQADFACGIADAVMAGTEPAHAVMYGHGLLGSHLEVDAGNIVAMSNEHNAMYCATKWAGFSDDDIPTAITALQDLSNFAVFTDRMQQGLLNQLVLGRMMLADNGLVTEPEFRRSDGSPVYDRSTLVYDGNSQGGIMGMALAGISQDFERAVLGVVGMNYSTLLPRSVDFDDFHLVFDPAYPSALDRALGLGVIQMLWDRTDGAGYVRHVVSDPLPDTPTKDVLMHVAFGDWQVSELTAMAAARTMGVPIHRPVTADDRSREVEPGWGIDTLDYDADRSALVIWDSGSDPIPIEQTAPRTSRDPHGDPRNDVIVRAQKAAFLFDGDLIDVCDAAACTAAPD
ncbi:MAG: hypothetical protein WBP59_11760 [Ilumatobacteraceae bacterium]